MKQKKNPYELPNLGCLLGVAYQQESSALEATLKEECKDITAPEYLVMRVIGNQEGQQLCEIGERLGKDKGAISRYVSSLVKKGLVRTESVSHKCLRAYLTPFGKSIQPTLLKVATIRETALAENLSPQEIDQLKTILTKIINL